jgi:serine/threonine protein kinase
MLLTAQHDPHELGLTQLLLVIVQVRIVRERTTQKIMAMKKLKKAEMLRRGQVSCLWVVSQQEKRLTCEGPAQATVQPQVPGVCIHEPTWWCCLGMGKHSKVYVVWHLMVILVQVEHVRAERNVLAEVHSPYVVKLYYSFQGGCNAPDSLPVWQLSVVVNLMLQHLQACYLVSTAHLSQCSSAVPHYHVQ